MKTISTICARLAMPTCAMIFAVLTMLPSLTFGQSTPLASLPPEQTPVRYVLHKGDSVAIKISTLP